MAPLAVLTGLFCTWLFVQSTFATPELVTASAVDTVPARRTQSRTGEEYEVDRYNQQEEREVLRRQFNPGNRICYGTGGAICSLALLIRCSTSLVGDEWFKCYCESGKVSIQVACQNCVNTYDLGGLSFNQTSWKSDCDKRGYTIGPIPSSALSSWSAFNATFTGNTVPLPKSTGTVSSTAGMSSARTTGSMSVAPFTGTSTRSRLPGEGEPGVTFTLYGDPTGSKVVPITVTTGTAPLQNVPLGRERNGATGSFGLTGNRLQVSSLGVLTSILLLEFL